MILNENDYELFVYDTNNSWTNSESIDSNDEDFYANDYPSTPSSDTPIPSPTWTPPKPSSPNKNITEQESLFVKALFKHFQINP